MGMVGQKTCLSFKKKEGKMSHATKEALLNIGVAFIVVTFVLVFPKFFPNQREFFQNYGAKIVFVLIIALLLLVDYLHRKFE